MMKKTLFYLFFLVTFQAAAGSHAADVVVVPGNPGSGEFYVRGVDFVDVGGVEIELQYDSTTMANPRITQGDMLASTMFVPNTKFRPNAVKIAAMSLAAIKGSGDLIKLNFDLKGQSPGIVTVTRKILSSSSGSSINTAASGNGTVGTVPVGNVGTGSIAGSGGATDGSTVTTSGSTTGTGSGGYVGSGTLTLSGSTYGSETASSSVGVSSTGSSISGGIAGISMGGATLPQDQMASTDKRPDYQPVVTDLRKDMSLPLGGAGGGSTTGKQLTSAEKLADDKSISYRSVSQIFKEFNGEREPKALIALFAATEIPDFKQEPAIAFSDGVTPLKLSLKYRPLSNESPKFIVQGASVQQLKSEGENFTWIVEAVPRKSVIDGKVTVIDGKRIVEFPLTVVPPANPALRGTPKPSEADFALYLVKPSRFDLNKDGKFDYLDDYIYTANYIAALGIKPEKPQTKAVKEPPKTEKKPVEQVKPGVPVQKGQEKALDKPAKDSDDSKVKPGAKKPVKKHQDKKQKDKDKKQDKDKSKETN